MLTEFVQSEGKTLSTQEQDDVLDVMTANITAISEKKPERLTRLRSDIEIVNLEILVTRFEDMTKGEHPEGEWQMFFNKNPFVLSMAFGYPIIVVQERATVGGRTLSGRGDSFTDFLVKNSMTNNTAIIEIKTPKAKLLNESTYRHECLFAVDGTLRCNQPSA